MCAGPEEGNTLLPTILEIRLCINLKMLNEAYWYNAAKLIQVIVVCNDYSGRGQSPCGEEHLDADYARIAVAYSSGSARLIRTIDHHRQRGHGIYTECHILFFSSIFGSTGCADINECLRDRRLCDGGQCRNVVGSFRCLCPTGYRMSNFTKACEGRSVRLREVALCIQRETHTHTHAHSRVMAIFRFILVSPPACQSIVSNEIFEDCWSGIFIA